MGLFGEDRRITEREMREVERTLRSKGWSSGKLRDLKKITSGHANEPGSQSGINPKEYRRLMKDLEGHKIPHRFTPEQRKTLGEELKKRLQ